MQYVPQPTLGAIVIAAALSLADVAGTRRLWQQRRMEFWLSMIALLGVAFLGVLPGIVVAVGAVDPERLPPDLVAAPDRAGQSRGAWPDCTT